MLKWVLIGVLVLIVLVAILFLVGLFLSVYYSIPYDEWVKMENERAKDELERKAKKEKRGKKHDR
jgi:hypothetical protein